MNTADRSPRVVVTGSTRGIGRGLVEAFLDRGCRVIVSGRSPEGVRSAVSALGPSSADRLLGVSCDVCSLAEVQALWVPRPAASGGWTSGSTTPG